MWKQLLFWGIAGPKHLRRFALLWFTLMAVFLYAFVHDAFDRTPPTSANRPPGPAHDHR
jgi:hypothetical protein